MSGVDVHYAVRKSSAHVLVGVARGDVALESGVSDGTFGVATFREAQCGTNGEDCKQSCAPYCGVMLLVMFQEKHFGRIFLL